MTTFLSLAQESASQSVLSKDIVKQLVESDVTVPQAFHSLVARSVRAAIREIYTEFDCELQGCESADLFAQAGVPFPPDVLRASLEKYLAAQDIR
ncbi:MAG TPA: hypothetical protein VG269_29395 [Tepidisphaeraceae bacterium]|jgi:hypothetical protein|nr:hypothetical protein [Tepidisphaeraceae bacterium]